MMNSNVQKITNALGKNSNYWAFTGSIALWYHSLNRNIEPRTPQDIDIIIDPISTTYVIAALSKLGWIMQSKGSARITFQKGTKHLDLIFAGSRLAPTLNSVMRYRNSPPIVNIQSLFNRKKMITPNKKRNENLNRLRVLGGKTPKRNRSPIRVGGGRKLMWD
jgi:hypothetical protein